MGKVSQTQVCNEPARFTCHTVYIQNRYKQVTATVYYSGMSVVSQESSIEQEQHFECSVLGIWRQMKNSINTRMCNEYTEVPTSPDNRRGLTGSRQERSE